MADKSWKVIPEESYVVDDATGCWNWTRAKQSAGYGHFVRQGKNVLAHRWLYERAHGPIAEGMFLCHRCDNPGCVNLAHMFIGDGKANMRDCAAKGRTTFQKHPELNRGESNGRARFTESDVRRMHRMRIDLGLTASQIADRIGVPRGTVHSALHVHWAHIRKEVGLG